MLKTAGVLPACLAALVLCAGAEAQEPDPVELPVRGLHLGLWGNTDVDALEAFIREALPREGVNVLVVSLGY